MKQTLLSFLLMIVLSPALFGQIAGEGVFNFLQLTNSAETAALGGIQVALPDPDPELLLRQFQRFRLCVKPHLGQIVWSLQLAAPDNWRTPRFNRDCPVLRQVWASTSPGNVSIMPYQFIPRQPQYTVFPFRLISPA